MDRFLWLVQTKRRLLSWRSVLTERRHTSEWNERANDRKKKRRLLVLGVPRERKTQAESQRSKFVCKQSILVEGVTDLQTEAARMASKHLPLYLSTHGSIHVSMHLFMDIHLYTSECVEEDAEADKTSTKLLCLALSTLHSSCLVLAH